MSTSAQSVEARRIDFTQLPLCVGIVGSRDFPRLDVVNAFVHRLRDGTEVVSGGARGVDRAAVLTAKARGLGWREFLPDESLPSPSRFFIRNSEIVDYVRDRQGVIVAFSLSPTTSGTNDTLKKSKKFGVPTITYNYSQQGRITTIATNFIWDQMASEL